MSRSLASIHRLGLQYMIFGFAGVGADFTVEGLPQGYLSVFSGIQPRMLHLQYGRNFRHPFQH